MNRKIAERYQRKKAILNGALKSYSKHGIDSMTMDNIASDSDFGMYSNLRFNIYDLMLRKITLIDNHGNNEAR